MKGLGRRVNLIAGRATFTDRSPKFYGYVHREVTSAAARLAQFLTRNGVATDESVNVINDDAGELRRPSGAVSSHAAGFSISSTL